MDYDWREQLKICKECQCFLYDPWDYLQEHYCKKKKKYIELLKEKCNKITN